ncbi:hypothetical protein BJ165DRAFT_1463322 [Panaeolus papilionaceus]|nr:hypothetical protein BJ165DRAFT_1463322 [Panaeolus papilionaceus]
MPLILDSGVLALVCLCLQGMFVVTGAARTQTPFHVQEYPVRNSLPSESPWDFHQKPGVNDSSNLVFNSVSSLLQHWPNTRYRNGEYHCIFRQYHIFNHEV